MFSVPVILAFIVSILVTFSIVNVISRKRKSLKQEKVEGNAENCEVSNLHKNNKNCWCSEYDLSKGQKIEIFEKYGDQFCGKKPSTIIKNNEIDPFVDDKFNAHDTLTRLN